MDSVFIDISYKDIMILLSVVQQTQAKTMERITALCREKIGNVEGSIRFAEELQLVKIKDNNIKVTKNFELVTKTSSANKAMLKSIFIGLLVNSKKNCKKQFQEYLGNFHHNGQEYSYRPTILSSSKYKDIRNFLVELGLIIYIRDTKVYIISPKHIHVFLALHKVKGMSSDELKYILIKKDELGMAAEKEIIKYEKKRLSEFPYLVRKIEHTARKNVTAGYDIKSWEIDSSTTADKLHLERYIEVKAISIHNSSFYWSKNEIEKAEKYRNNYYLYLLPVISHNKFNLEELEIICDPYKNVFNNLMLWERKIESYNFLKAN